MDSELTPRHRDLLRFLNDARQELEDAQGKEDPEIRQALETLQRKSEEIQEAARRAAAAGSFSQQAEQPLPSDVEIASNLNRLEKQLTEVEHKIDGASGQTKELLGHSLAIWLSDGEQHRLEQDPADAPIAR